MTPMSFIVTNKNHSCNSFICLSNFALVLGVKGPLGGGGRMVYEYEGSGFVMKNLVKNFLKPKNKTQVQVNVENSFILIKSSQQIN